MGIIGKIKFLLKVRKPAEKLIEEASKVKSGYKTTEFWLTILSNLLAVAGALQGVIDPKTAAVVVAVLTGLYNTLRTVAKAGETPASSESETPKS